MAVGVVDGSEIQNSPAHIDGAAIKNICQQDAAYVVVRVPW